MVASLTCNKAYFIAAIDTDLGKSFLVENLCEVYLQNKIAITAIKPVASGFKIDDETSDCARILKALGKEPSQENVNLITPWQFLEASSPNFAAKKEQKSINFDEIVDFCQKNIENSKKNGEILLIESAGGIMTPINDDKTFLDLSLALKIPVLLLTANYLGSISQTLCAAEALNKNNIFIERIILNENLEHFKKTSSASDFEVMKIIENISGVKTALLNNFIKI